MIIKLAKNSGFCFGVKRAINMATSEAKKRNCKLVTIGPIIHNPQVVSDLEAMNVFKVDNVEEVENNTPAIIRSHGLAKDKIDYLKSRNIEVIDATCPNVVALHQTGKRLCKDGYFLVILGNKKHPEVEALTSYLEGQFIVIDSVDELPELHSKKIALISQTTRRFACFKAIGEKLLEIAKELLIVNTICNSTTVRQNSTRKLAQKSDLMLVIGGKMSSNTKMLAQISAGYTETYHIETFGEINPSWLEGKENIGLSAGASTPDYLIIEVYNFIIKKSRGFTSISSVDEIPVF